MKPRVSVVIPVRNGERTIARAIESALAQEFEEPIEVIAVNDGSTDHTCDVLARYASRIRVISQPHSGVSAARNSAVKASTGDYIAFLDADDEWLPKKLARVVPLLDEASDVVLVYHDAAKVDLNGQIRELSIFADNHSALSFEELLNPKQYKGTIYPSITVMRRVAFDACGGFNEQMTACEDHYLWIRAREDGEFRFLPEVLARKEDEPNSAREQWYVEGSKALNQVAQERYGARFSGDFHYRMLWWSGRKAYLRGDRWKAFRRYFAAARRRPRQVKIYLLLVLALIPRRVSAAIVALMPRALQQKLLPEIMRYLFSPYPRSKAKSIGGALRDSAAAFDIIADAPSSTQLNPKSRMRPQR
jgi:glycosyltransferase involved in cell wall biosynthesis